MVKNKSIFNYYLGNFQNKYLIVLDEERMVERYSNTILHMKPSQVRHSTCLSVGARMDTMMSARGILKSDTVLNRWNLAKRIGLIWCRTDSRSWSWWEQCRLLAFIILSVWYQQSQRLIYHLCAIIYRLKLMDWDWNCLSVRIEEKTPRFRI